MPRTLESPETQPSETMSTLPAPPEIEVPGAFTISVFTRHSAECPHHDKPAYKGCKCRKSLYIREGGKTRYVSAQTRSWAQAEVLAAEERRKRDPNEIEKERLAAEKAALDRIRQLRSTTLSDALDEWIAGHKEIRKDSTAAYKSTARQILRWAKKRKLVNVSDVTYPLMHRWYSSWSPEADDLDNRLSLNSQRTLLIRLKAFFSWAYLLKMADEDPTALLKAISLQEGQTWPLTKAQFEEVIEATRHIDEDARYEFAKVGVELRAIFYVQRWTGLRIGDVVSLRKSALNGNRLSLTTQKTEADMTCVLPDFVVEALHALPERGIVRHHDYFFKSRRSQPKTETNKWVRKVRRLKPYLNLVNENGEPMEFRSHMLRDTFAVEMLLHGVPLEKVSKLLSHKSVGVTERYYAKWVEERKRQLESEAVAAMRRMGVTVSV